MAMGQSTKHSPNGLTYKQENFAQNLAKGETIAEAYRNAYDASGMKPSTVNSTASRLASKHNIRQRVAAIVAQQTQDALHCGIATREFVLMRLRDEAVRADSPAAARIRALELLGKTDFTRLFATDVQHTHEIRPAKEVKAELEQRLRRLIASKES